MKASPLIGERQFRAGFGQGLGDAPGDGAFIGDAHDQAPFAFHQAFERHICTPCPSPPTQCWKESVKSRKSMENRQDGPCLLSNSGLIASDRQSRASSVTRRCAAGPKDCADKGPTALPVNPAASPLQNAVLRFDAEIFAGSATQIVVRSVPYRRLAAAQCEQGEAAGQLLLGPDDDCCSSPSGASGRICLLLTIEIPASLMFLRSIKGRTQVVGVASFSVQRFAGERQAAN